MSEGYLEVGRWGWFDSARAKGFAGWGRNVLMCFISLQKMFSLEVFKEFFSFYLQK